MNLQAIRAEIEALYEEKRDKRKYSGDYRGGWDDCVERVLAKLDSHIEPKIEPTEAGLWQCTKNGANHIIDVGEGLTYPSYCKGGEWAKVRGI